MRMPTRRFLALLFVLIGTISGAIAADDAVPYPQQLSVGVRGSDVRIRWAPIPDYERRYLLYRHTKPITEDSFKDAELLAVLPTDRRQYTDTFVRAGTYHFAVLAEGPDARPYAVFVPRSNTTDRAVAVGDPADEQPAVVDPSDEQPAVVDPSTADPAAEVAAVEVENAARITAVEASVVDGSVRVSFRSDRRDRELVVVRSINPFDETASRAGTVEVTRVASTRTRVTDTPPPGMPAWYAVFDAEILAAGSAELPGGLHSTTQEVRLPPVGPPPILARTSDDAPANRAARLPAIRFEESLRTGERLPPPALDLPPGTQLSESTDGAVRRLISRSGSEESIPDRNVQVLSAERDDGSTGNQGTLRQIVRGAVESRQWETAEQSLYGLLSVLAQAEPTSGSDRDRAGAYFYLGQAFYFTERYDMATFAFLQADIGGVAEARTWIRRALDARAASGLVNP